MDPTLENVETRLSAGRARLILDRPFLGALVLRLPLKIVNAAWCSTTATDAREIFVNPSYISSLTLSQIEFVLAHEALHCALGHFARRQHRDLHRWDLACDFAVNPLLIDDGLVAPPDTLYLPEYSGLSAEEIYPLIDNHLDKETHDQHLYDSNNKHQQQDASCEEGSSMKDEEKPPPKPLSAKEKESLEQQWSERLAGAAQQALQSGKLSASLARTVDNLIAPSVPWRNLLGRYMSLRTREDFDYSRPGRREGDAVLPSLRGNAIGLVVAIDTSGSISNREISEFLSEIDVLKGQVKARVSLVACDAQISKDSPLIFEPWESITFPSSFSGGGGTDFTPVFEWTEAQNHAPDLLVYFTDAKGKFPDFHPSFPVLWLVKGSEEVPWGQRIQLN